MFGRPSTLLLVLLPLSWAWAEAPQTGNDHIEQVLFSRPKAARPTQNPPAVMHSSNILYVVVREGCRYCEAFKTRLANSPKFLESGTRVEYLDIDFDSETIKGRLGEPNTEELLAPSFYLVGAEAQESKPCRWRGFNLSDQEASFWANYDRCQNHPRESGNPAYPRIVPVRQGTR